ncbi:MAG: sugar phosphate isomerase/epimerase [Patescibacteria group bacterium]
MEIGVSTFVKTGKNYLERFKDLVNLGFKNIEFYNSETRIRTVDLSFLKKIKRKKHLNYSLHSMVQDLFCADKSIAEAEYYCLKGEIHAASLIGCSRVIFHIAKKTALSVKEKSQLSALIIWARKQSIKLCLENNHSVGAFSGAYLMQIKSIFPSLYFCLDIGHLNIVLNRREGIDMNKFLSALKNKILELHINSNNGLRDQHLALGKKTEKYFMDILKSLNNKNIAVIIETRDIKQALRTRNFIKSIEGR